MRTQLILTTAVLGVAGAIGASAQAVYSVNAVGYINASVDAGKYKILVNQLKVGSNKIEEVLPTVPENTQVLVYKATGFDANAFEGGWDTTKGTVLAPGEGFFLRAPAGTKVDVTFVGEVPQGTLSTPLRAGNTLTGSQVPQAGTLEQLGYVASEGDKAFTWNYAAQGYNPVDVYEGGWGTPGGPTLAVAEGLFIQKAAAGSWNRTFSVNQ